MGGIDDGADLDAKDQKGQTALNFNGDKTDDLLRRYGLPDWHKRVLSAEEVAGLAR